MTERLPAYEEISPYIPGAIRDWYAADRSGQPHVVSHLAGMLICLDASGFTALTRELERQGKEGPEILTRALNRFFDEMSRVTFGFDGDILKFAGDALWALFPLATDPAELFRAVLERLDVVNHSPELQGRTHLSVHLGAETGRFDLASLGNPEWRLEAEPIGKLVGTVYRACDLGGDNECVVGPELAAQFSGCRSLDMPHEDFALLTAAEQSPEWHERTIISKHGEQPETGRLCRYLPAEVSARLAETNAALIGQSEYRLVTVLFVRFQTDTDGPMTDNALAKCSRQLADCFDIVREEHGSIARIDPFKGGHKLLLLFGAPVKHEHDELSALNCARRLLKQSDGNCHLCIGLARGSLYCGDVGAAGRREYTVMGSGINMAARLMAQASVGEILIDDALRQRLPKDIRTETITLALKGVGDEVEVHRFTGLTEAACAEGRGATIVGQQDEFERVVAGWDQARQGRLQMVHVEAGRGVGKTTLLHRVAEHFGDRAVLLDGSRASLFGSGWLARRLLLELFALPSDSSKTDLTQAVTARVDERWLPLLDGIVATGASENRWTRGLSAELRSAKTGQLFVKIVRSLIDSPRVMLIDDLDRSDELSRTLVGTLLSERNLPLLTVVTTGPDFEGLDDNEAASGMAGIELAEPAPHEWRDFFAQTFEPGKRESELLDRILKASDGNPQYVTQFLDHCRSEGKLVANRVSGRWELASSDFDITPPESLTDLNLAQLDRLPETERYVAKCASVPLGDFSIGELARIATGLQPAEVSAAVESLVRKSLLAHSGSRRLYRFGRSALREAIHSCLPESTLRELHGEYGRILEERETKPSAAILAYHFFRAAMTGPGFDYSHQAAVEAFRVHSLQEGATHFGRCEQLIESDQAGQLPADKVMDFYRDQAKFLVHDGQYARAYRTFRHWRRRARDAGQPGRALEAAVEEAGVLWMQSRYERCRAFLMPILRSEGFENNHTVAATAYTYLAGLERRTGDLPRSQEAARRAIALAKPAGDSATLADAHNELGLAQWGAGELKQAAESFQRCLELAREHQGMYAEAKTANNLAIIKWESGDLLAAEELMARAVEIFLNTGDRRNESYASGNIAALYRIFGQLTQAQARFERADLIFEKCGDRHAHFYTVGNLGDLDLVRGDLNSAARRFREAIAFAREVGDKELEAECRIRQGEVAFFRAQHDLAQKLYDESIDLAREVGSSEYLIRGAIGRARLSIQLRQPARARKDIEIILAESEKNNADISKFEAVFLQGEHDRISGNIEAATRGYRDALEYARSQRVFELTLKSAMRLYEYDPESKDRAAEIIQALIEQFDVDNAPVGWDEISGTVYYSYFAPVVREILTASRRPASHTV